MIENRIQDIAARIQSCRAVTQQDVELLWDLTLPGGYVTRDEAADLLRIERHVRVRHESWSTFFIETISAHFVWERRPVGIVGADDAQWLIERLGLNSTGHTRNSAELIAAMIADGADLHPSLLGAGLMLFQRAA